MQFYYRRFDQQHGPISWEALVALAREGGLYPTDPVWSPGWPAWQEARQVAGLFPEAPITQPPAVAPGSSPYSPYSPYSQHKPMGDDPMARMLLPVGRSPWAIVAGYLGLFSVLMLPAPFAIVTGILAVRDIRRNPHYHGMGRAVFAIIMGTLGCIFFVGVFVTRYLGK